MSNTTDEMIAVLCAFKEGKPIEVQNYGEWVPWEGGAKFNFQVATYRIKPEPPKPDYLAGHKASGLKVGDLVRVTREAASKEGGWNNCWIPEMSGRVKPEKIIMDYNDRGFHLENGGNFPFFVLEKVEPLEFWVNTYQCGNPCVHNTEESARDFATPGALRIAVHMREVMGGEA